MIDWQSKVISPLIGVFGQPASFMQQKDGWSTQTPLDGVFDAAYEDVDVADGMPVTTTTPCFGFNVLDLPFEVKQKDKILIYAALGAPLVDTLYIVKKVRPDGHGWCRLMLNVAPVSADSIGMGAQDF